jgi:Zn-dependent protease with chaperone function
VATVGGVAVYRVQLAIGGTGLAAAAGALGLGVSAVRVAPADAHRLSVGGMRFTYPALNAAAAILLGFAALGAAVLVVTVRAAIRHRRAHRTLVKSLPVAGVHGDATVIEASEPLAFCAGWLRPRIFVSRAAVEQLSDAELDAVLAHERHHRARRDPLRLAVGRILCHALFFLPVLRPLQARESEAAELRADAAAIAAVDVAPLASALLILGATGDGVVGVSPERVDHLLGETPTWRPPWLLLVAALTTLAALIPLLWRVSESATVAATLNVSSQPCVLVLALVPVVAGLAGCIYDKT